MTLPVGAWDPVNTDLACAPMTVTQQAMIEGERSRRDPRRCFVGLCRMGHARRSLSVPLMLQVVFTMACQPAAAPPAKPAESKPAESKPAEAAKSAALAAPTSPLLSLLTDRAGMMVSTKATEATGDDSARKPVGTGPFSFVEWVKDDRVVLKKNPGSWDKDASGTQLPYLDGIVYKPIPDQVQRLNALKTGTVDIIDIPPR